MCVLDLFLQSGYANLFNLTKDNCKSTGPMSENMLIEHDQSSWTYNFKGTDIRLRRAIVYEIIRPKMTFNVRGELIETFARGLLATMFENKNICKTDDEGRICIDEDPALFEVLYDVFPKKHLYHKLGFHNLPAYRTFRDDSYGIDTIHCEMYETGLHETELNAAKETADFNEIKELKTLEYPKFFRTKIK